LIFVALFIDKSNPNMGFFWLDEAAAFFSGNHTAWASKIVDNLKI